MLDKPEISDPSEYTYLNLDPGKKALSRLVKFLVFIAVIAGVIVAANQVPVLSDFFERYAHLRGEAFLVFVLVFYFVLQRGYKQSPTKAITSRGPILKPTRHLVNDLETYLYVDCAVLSRNIYQLDTGETLPYEDFFKGDLKGSDVFELGIDSSKEERIQTDWELIERIGNIEEMKLVIEVHKHTSKNVYNQHDGVTYAIVFRGSVGLNSWIANAHWLVKWLPYEDQYDQIKYIVPELVERINARHPEGEVINIIATGHSLGGGLAQHACYISDEIRTAYVFNSTPVTGFTDFSRWQRLLHSNGVRIHRMFERGEILEYFRFFMKLVYLFNPKPNSNPHLVEHRLDFKKAGFITEHGMLPIAVMLCFLRDYPEVRSKVEIMEQEAEEKAFAIAMEKKKELMARVQAKKDALQPESV